MHGRKFLMKLMAVPKTLGYRLQVITTTTTTTTTTINQSIKRFIYTLKLVCVDTLTSVERKNIGKTKIIIETLKHEAK